MAIGRTFKESLQKALRGLETGRFGLGCDQKDRWGTPDQPTLDDPHQAGHAQRRTHLVHPLRLQGRPDHGGDPRADRASTVVSAQYPRDRRRGTLRALGRPDEAGRALLWDAKQNGFSDRQLAFLWDTERHGGPRRCASAAASRRCSSRSTRARPSSRRSRRTITRRMRTRTKTPPQEARAQGTHHDPGRRANRIGQGIEFDYCCCQAGFALRSGLRDDHGQLQSGDRLDRLRHQRHALLRAVDRRGRAQHLRSRASRRA